jgi:hypothetical protein
MFAHQVFFSLNDGGDAARTALVDGCHKYLAPIPGIVFYAAGTLAAEMRREVNDREFDVALHVVFTDRAAHDAYAVAPSHQEFIEKFQSNWKQVRVFDSHVAGV